MKKTTAIDTARVELLLGELRLPGIKLIWPKLAEQADKEGWPAMLRHRLFLAEEEAPSGAGGAIPCRPGRA